MAQKINETQRTGGFAMGVISGATLGSTGNKAVTGVGFTPKLVRFTVLFPANATVAAGAFGAMTTSDQFYSAWSTQPSASNVAARNSSTSACIGWVPANTSTPSLLATYVSMDSDGFTINVTSAASNFSVAWEAYG